MVEEELGFVKKVTATNKARILLLRSFDKLTEEEKVDFLVANQYDEDREFMPEFQCQ
jgi:hypothetical protein